MMKDDAGHHSIDSKSFEAIAQLAYGESGLQLVAEKTSMIQSRLRHRLRALSIPDFENYSAFVCSEEGRSERRHMISALTTNVSHFFREMHHFDVLKELARHSFLPKLRTGGRVRIWSAGCSNGQEAFSIAMTLLKEIPNLADLDFRILATDIDAEVIEFSRAGKYSDRLTTGVPDDLLETYFRNGKDQDEVIYEAHPSLKNLISFKELNLLSKWPMQQEMDVIFCRNVVIYFDVETQNRLWPRFRDILATDGYLFLGHSERIGDPQSVGFTTDGPTTYRPIQKTAR